MVVHKFLSLAAVAAAIGAAGPAHAAVSVFEATLNGATEEPSVKTPAIGHGVVTFDDVALTVGVNESFAGLTSDATASHIHCCTATPGVGNAPVALAFSNFPSNTSGFYVNTFTLAAASFQSLLTGTLAGESYLNIHDALNPGGEIRGYLTLTPAVPEPGTWALMGTGLALLGWSARTRKLG